MAPGPPRLNQDERRARRTVTDPGEGAARAYGSEGWEFEFPGCALFWLAGANRRMIATTATASMATKTTDDGHRADAGEEANECESLCDPGGKAGRNKSAQVLRLATSHHRST